YVGIVRTNERLQKAWVEISDIRSQVSKLYASGKLSRELLELRNLVTVACLVVQSAMQRKESRGLHYNLDYPQTDDVNWKHDTILSLSSATHSCLETVKH
ncbi:MAG: L-aspartate oxidase, partial [Armatimonadetes bacterium]|nr:L-aspartate oxidase [Armatimonadota bacterium]